MFLGSAPEYHNMNMYGGAPQHTMAPSQEANHATGAFGRMTLSNDQALEKLAANVRAATTTSASDRAKQIFVQAWCVSYFFFFFVRCYFFFLTIFPSGLTLTMRHIPMVTFLDKVSTFLIVESVTNTESLTSTRPLWVKLFDCVFRRSKLAALGLEETANITVRSFVHHTSRSLIRYYRLRYTSCYLGGGRMAPGLYT